MRKVNLALIIASFAGSAMAADITAVAGGGDWSNSSTWSGGTVPTSSDTVYFSQSGDTVTIDKSGLTVGMISIGDGQTETLNLASGSKLTTSQGLSGVSMDSSILTITGSGQLTSSGGTIDKLTINFDLEPGTSLGWSSVNITNTNINVYSTMTGPRYNIMTNSTLTIKSGAEYTVSGGHLNGWGRNCSLIVESGGSVILTGNNGYNMETTELSGSLYLPGYFNVATQKYSARMVNATFNAGASVTQTNASYDVIWGDETGKIKGNIVVNSGVNTGALSFAGKLYVQSNTTVELNSSDVIATGGSSTQASSVLSICHTKTANSVMSLSASTGGELIVNADQNFGGIEFYTGSDLKLTIAEGATLNVGGFYLMSGASGDVKIMLNEFGKDSLFINSMTQSEIEDIAFYDSTGTERLIAGEDFNIVAGEYNGLSGYWVANAIPEPAEWAAIFGACALLFCVVRRRK